MCDDLSQRPQADLPLGRDNQHAAIQERTPYLQRCRVKGDGGVLQDPLFGAERHEILPLHQTDHAPVWDNHAFGHTGRAGGEHHIGHRSVIENRIGHDRLVARSRKADVI